MARSRTQTLLSLLKGLAGAILLTLLLMAAMAAFAAMGRISDSLLMALNQLMKLAAILLGVTLAVGRGGRRGFLTGMTLAMLYMALGYGCYSALGGSAFSTPEFLGEVMIGAAIGATAGAVLSNLPARRRTA
ncbi:MAG: TIGR04086 family membrane protein [Clostridia bacterium]|nr:TIGR04086 family membrane protein [Clostridia bacterium]